MGEGAEAAVMLLKISLRFSLFLDRCVYASVCGNECSLTFRYFWASSLDSHVYLCACVYRVLGG